MRQQSFITIKFDWLIFAFIFIAPIAYLPKVSQYGLQLLIFDYGTLFLFAVSYFMQRRAESKNFILPTILLTALIVSLFVTPKMLPLSLFQIALAAILYKTITEYAVSVRFITNAFICCILLNLFFVAFQLCNIDLVYVVEAAGWKQLMVSHAGLMGRDYHLAYLIALCLPLAFHKNKFLGLFFVIALIVQQSSATYLAAIVGLSLYSISNFRLAWKNVLIGLASALLIGGVASQYHYVNLYLRFDTWNAIGNEVFVNPFIGAGLGMFDQTFLGRPMNGIFIMSSYNEIIKSVFELGFFPTIICVTVIGGALYRLFQRARNDDLAKALICGVISAVVIMMFHETLKFIRTAIPILIMLALCEARICQVEKLEEENR